MALAICLLFDPPADRALRGLWRRVEELGVASMASHTHGRHLPHLSYAVLRSGEPATVRDTLEAVPDGGPLTLHLTAVACAPRGRIWLVPAASAELVGRQHAVLAALATTDAELHRHYVRDRWLPHVSVVPRARLADLPAVADAAYAVLPMAARVTHAAVIDSSTGEQWALARTP